MTEKRPNRPAPRDPKPAPLGHIINPLAIYDSEECMEILGIGRATLTRYQEERGFPLRPVDTGRAIGQDILDWLRAQKPRSRKRPKQ